MDFCKQQPLSSDAVNGLSVCALVALTTEVVAYKTHTSLSQLVPKVPLCTAFCLTNDKEHFQNSEACEILKYFPKGNGGKPLVRVI